MPRRSRSRSPRAAVPSPSTSTELVAVMLEGAQNELNSARSEMQRIGSVRRMSEDDRALLRRQLEALCLALDRLSELMREHVREHEESQR